jgi:AGCS family alanine or glycine:cation symporter
MTALVIVITGAYNNPEYAQIIADKQGAALTAAAFSHEVSWFPYVLSVAVFLFAFSTMISWSYYGERCVVFLTSEKFSVPYKCVLLIVVFLGAISTAHNVFDFGDLMILGMGVPNVLGLYIMHGKVKEHLNTYLEKLKSGEIKPYK